MVYVDNSQITPLYANTAPGTTADASVVDPAIAALVTAINTNADLFTNFIGAITGTPGELGIPDQSIVERHLRNLAVTNPKLAPLAVTADKIANGTITTAKLADLLVTASKIADGTITEPKYGTGSVSSRAIANYAVDATKMNPALFEHITDIATNARFGQIDAQLADTDHNLNVRWINVTQPPTPFVAAKGDGITDDWSALQALHDYAYEYGYRVFYPKGTYNVSKPIIVYGYSGEYGNYSTTIEGAGRDLTIIKKTTNSTLATGDYAGVDSVFLIGNEYDKNGISRTNIFSTQSIAFKIFFSNLTLKTSAPTAVAHGFYSLGIMHAKFYNVTTYGIGTAFKTTRYCSFATFERIEVYASTGSGFDVWSDASGATTLLFIDVHLNGCNGYGYRIKGHGTFINCSNDGGTLIPYYFLCSRVTLINCHSESPAASGFMYADGNTTWGPSTITIINCGIMTPLSTTNPTIQANNMTVITIRELKVSTSAVSGLPSIPQGSLYSAGRSSRVVFETPPRLLGAEYANYVPIIVSEDQKKIIVDRNHLSATQHTYIPYVPGSVSSGDYTVATVTQDTTNHVLVFTSSGTSGNGWQGLFFDEALKLDGYSRLYMKATVDFVQTTASECSLRVQNQVRNTTYVGTAATYVSRDARTTDATDYEWFIDISALFGTYYAEVILATPGTLTIKEISLLK